MSESASLARFGLLASAPTVPLGEAALVAASFLGHPSDVDDGLVRLAELAESVDGDDLASVTGYLFTEAGFRGDQVNYYNPVNSLLPAVLERRRGIPITLAILAVDVARRRGVGASVVGMPGHVFVADGDEPTLFIDGFNGGQLLDARGAQAKFEQLHGSRAPFDPRYLGATPDPLVLARMLANLMGICRNTGDAQMLVRVHQLRAAIPGVGRHERAAFGDALAAVGRYAEAAEVWEEERQQPIGPRSNEADATIARLRASLN